MSVHKLAVQWANNGAGGGAWSGGPGFSIFYATPAQMNPAPFGTFFAALAPFIPLTITITVPNSGQVLDEVTGKVTGVWSTGTQVATPGTGTNTFAPQSGAQVKWYTNSWANGRRVVGRTFFVPLSTGNYAGSGLLSATTCNAIQAAADTLRSQLGNGLQVWHRPIYKKAPVEGDPPTLVRSGAIYPVSSSACPTKPATLNKRRDV